MPGRLFQQLNKSPDHSTLAKSNPVTLTDEASAAEAASAVSGTSGISSSSLSVAQRAQIKKVFAADLQSGIQPRTKRVVALMKSDPLLRSLVNSKPHVKSVLDRVRYLFESQQTSDPYALPEESPAERTAAFVVSIPEKPPSTIESGRVEWLSEETLAIREAIMFCKHCPGNEEIRALFGKTQVLRDIFKQNPFDRVRNKVKNEFRKLNN